MAHSLLNSMTLHDDGFRLLNDLLQPGELDALRDNVRQCLQGNNVHPGDTLVPNAPAGYGNPLMDDVLARLLPQIEAASGRRLFPTYSYFRIYRKGDRLPRHKDRPSCEISVTLTIDYDAPEPWPIWIENAEGVHAIEIPKGCGLLYKGIELSHWREEFRGNWAIQVFLHYVDQSGPYSEYRFDKRSRLGTPFVSTERNENQSGPLPTLTQPRQI